MEGAGGPETGAAALRLQRELKGARTPVRAGRTEGGARPTFREMVQRVPADGSRPPEGVEEAARLAWAARELEAFFLQELWRAMRRSIPQGGLFRGAPGSRMFEEMLDEERSRLMAASNQLGLAALIYERTLPYVLRSSGGGADHDGSGEDGGSRGER